MPYYTGQVGEYGQPEQTDEHGGKFSAAKAQERFSTVHMRLNLFFSLSHQKIESEQPAL